MSEEIGRLIKFNMRLTSMDPNENESINENSYAIGELFTDGFFYGFMCIGVDEKEFEEGECGISHLIVGVYDKNLGLDLISLPRDPEETPTLYRTLKNGKEFTGKLYSVEKVQYIILGNEANIVDAINYNDFGETSIKVEEEDLDFNNYSTIRAIDDDFNNFFINPDYAKYYANSFKEQSSKELQEDIEKFYKETHGEQFGD